MDKSYGLKKRKFINKNKKKYSGKDNIGCLNNVCRNRRKYIRSYMNFVKDKPDLLYDIIMPTTTGRTFTWWDDVPFPTKHSKLHRTKLI